MVRVRYWWASTLLGIALLSTCLVPGCDTDSDSESASAALKRGNDLFQQGEIDASISAYTKAIRIDPNNSKAYRCRTSAYYAKHDFDNMIADSTMAIHLDPTSVDAYVGRAHGYLGKKDFDRAIADSTEGIRLAPEAYESWFGRAEAHLGQGDLDRAIADYTEAIRLAPPNGPFTALPYFQRGVAYNKKGDKAKAEEDFARAEQLDQETANWTR